MTAWTNASGSGVTYFVCECCTEHGDTHLLPDVVRCRECGQPCSCEGCIAEADPTEPPRTAL